MNISEEITSDYCAKIVSKWNRYGYPDRVLEVAQAHLAGTATEADMEEMRDLIDITQAAWVTTTSEEN